MPNTDSQRRKFLVTAGTAAALAVAAPAFSLAGGKKKMPPVEDLMREHGILRRALLVYTDISARLKQGATGFDPAALHKTAYLFRTFGEDYHERKLEEDHVFPAVRKSEKAGSSYVDILINQHNRGREITSYILAVSAARNMASAGEDLAKALDAFTWMYRNHAAREDTVIFQTWRKQLSASQLKDMSDEFEHIEHQQFGGNGFKMALKDMRDIEASLGMKDLSQFTAPAPPPAPQ